MNPPTTGAHWLDVVLLLCVCLAILGGGGAVIHNILKRSRKIGRFFDAILGRPAEFGQPAVPGMLERMDRGDEHDAQQAEVLRHVVERMDKQDSLLKQLVPNGGGSLRDQTDRIEADQARLAGIITQVAEDVAQVRGDVTQHIRSADEATRVGKATETELRGAIGSLSSAVDALAQTQRESHDSA